MADGLRAGMGRTTITPLIGTPMQSVFRNRNVDTIDDEIYAKSLVLDDGNTTVAIVNLDVMGMPDGDVRRLRALVAEQTHISAENVLVACTHMHSGPAMFNMGENTRDEAYCEWLIERAADSVRLAVKRLRPARVGNGVGRMEGVSFCRRYLMSDGTVRMNPGRSNPDVVRPVGPVDPEVGVLYVESADREPLAVVTTYSLHYVGTDGGNAVSPDYFGHFADAMKQIKGEHFAGLLLNGASGDINNIDLENTDTLRGHAKAKRVAGTLAGEVTRIIGGIKTSDKVTLKCVSKAVELPRKTITDEDIRVANQILAGDGPVEGDGPFSWVVGQPMPPGHRPIYARECLAMAQMPESVRTEVQVIRVGDAAFVAFPGEIFAEIGLSVKEASVASHTFVTGLSNGYVGYVAPDRALKEEGGYETWASRWAQCGVGTEDILRSSALELLAGVFS